VSIVCVGEALVDLIGEPSGRDPERYTVHFGGALANVAVGIARAGAPAALAGGSGADDFGRFLRERLRSEGVDLRFHAEIPGLLTPFAFVRIDDGGEPHFRIHGDGIEAGLAAVAGREDELVEAAEAVVVGSNTLVAEPGRSVTLTVIERAEAAGVPVLFDPNLRPGRWQRLDEAVELCREVAGRCTVLKSNLTEARLLAGSEPADAAAAAAALIGLGVPLAVVTAGPLPAAARGAASAEKAPPTVPDPQPLGAGDAFMAALTAALHRQAWQLGEVETALERAVEASAATCRRTGATA
jgi:fructokinase